MFDSLFLQSLMVYIRFRGQINFEVRSSIPPFYKESSKPEGVTGDQAFFFRRNAKVGGLELTDHRKNARS